MEDIEKDEHTLYQHLPHDLVAQHILTRLPIKSLIKFKSVSKQWYSTLSSSHFVYTHFNCCPYNHPFSPTQFLFIQNRSNYYFYSYSEDDEFGTTTDISNTNLLKLRINFHDDDLVLIGSCNGLVCLASFYGVFFILWNPITGKFCKYSDPDNSFDSSSNCRVSWGFGHVSSVVDDYKIVRILELNASMEIRVHVFSLKSNKWKRIELMTKNHPLIAEDPYISLSFYSRQGVLVNKTLYWIVSNTNNWDRKIVAFDLENETFNTVFDMNLVSNDVYRDNFLCVMGGCLSKFGVNIRDDVYINMLKGDGKAESIRLSRDLRLRSCRSFVGFTKNGGFFVLMENSTIGIINPTSQPMNYKFTPLVSFECLGKSRVASYAPSLISPYYSTLHNFQLVNVVPSELILVKGK